MTPKYRIHIIGSPHHRGRRAAARRLQGGRYTVVVFEQKGEGSIVMTAVKVNKD